MANRKVAGILAESSGELDHTNFVILGIGLNVRGKPSLLDYEATALAEHITPPPRARILAAVLTHLDARYREFLQGNLAGILNRWKTLSLTLGQEVVAHTPTGKIHGVAKDITEEGALLLELGSGQFVEINAGEVSLRAGSRK
jgi:BirA family biotin operon repressor/biotin-[acetyl-CoA-carboxylase] ligase